MQVWRGGRLSFAGTVVGRETRDCAGYVTPRGPPSCSLASGQLCAVPDPTGEVRASKNLECIFCTDFRAENSKARDRARRNCE